MAKSIIANVWFSSSEKKQQQQQQHTILMTILQVIQVCSLFASWKWLLFDSLLQFWRIVLFGILNGIASDGGEGRNPWRIRVTRRARATLYFLISKMNIKGFQTNSQKNICNCWHNKWCGLLDKHLEFRHFLSAMLVNKKSITAPAL